MHEMKLLISIIRKGGGRLRTDFNDCLLNVENIACKEIGYNSDECGI